MASRPLVNVHAFGGDAKPAQLRLPEVFTAPIRPDIVHFVHTNMAKNKRQPYAAYDRAGMQHSAESWGTGRAVARIPRVSGGGNSRSGQAAFGNMCRKGRMFAATKTWRKWHRKINTNQKRYAVASALAASALPSLVLARGHRVEKIAEIPLVVDNSVESIKKTKEAVKALTTLGAYEDVQKAADSRALRRGVGKTRNRRHVQRRGPLVVFGNDQGVVKAFRNLPGVELANVKALNLLQLAPGGHLGRFIIWTRSAFEQLPAIWGSTTRVSTQKKGYTLPRSIVHNSDITRIINSDEVQSKVRPAIKSVTRFSQKKNPLKNLGVMVRLNPYALTARRSELLAQERRAKAKANAIKTARSKNAVVEEQKKAARARTHEPQQKINFQRIANDDFKAPEKAAALKIQKPRAAQEPPKALTAEQKKAKVEARKKAGKKAKAEEAQVEAAKPAAGRPKITLAMLAIAASGAGGQKKKKSSGGGAKGGKGKKEAGKAGGKAEAGKAGGKAEAKKGK